MKRRDRHLESLASTKCLVSYDLCCAVNAEYIFSDDPIDDPEVDRRVVWFLSHCKARSTFSINAVRCSPRRTSWSPCAWA